MHWEGLNSIETVYANKHKLQGNSWGNTMYSNTTITYFSPSHDNSTFAERYPFGQGWGAGPVSPALVEDWKTWSAQQTYLDGVTQDPRLTGSVWSYDALDPNNTGTVLIGDRKMSADEPNYTVSKRYYEQTGYFQKKYIAINSYYNDGFKPFGPQLYPEIAVATPSQTLHQIPDLILIRFADVLLMQSELKEDAAGLNRVRARSHLAPVAYSLNAIKNERRYELAFEALRWYDLLRWSGPTLEEAGNALNKQNGFTVVNAAAVVPMVQYDYKARLKETEGYWYIPQSEIDRSNGGIKQNPGWESADALFKDWNNM
ncbi:MAG: RagB/SusD family nutrient uptake outer membrane protein [Paludibacteraceae bacterium]